MEQKKQNPLNLFIIITGAVLAFQCLPQLSLARPIAFSGLGVVSKEAIYLLWLLIMVLSLILVVITTLSLLPRFIPKLNREKICVLFLFIGAIFAALGLASINLSGTVVSGTTSSFRPIGIELLCLGFLSMALFVDNMDERNFLKDVPNYFILLFFIFLVPAAFILPA
jgi:hypothetical protein